VRSYLPIWPCMPLLWLHHDPLNRKHTKLEAHAVSTLKSSQPWWCEAFLMLNLSRNRLFFQTLLTTLRLFYFFQRRPSWLPGAKSKLLSLSPSRLKISEEKAQLKLIQAKQSLPSSVAIQRISPGKFSPQPAPLPTSLSPTQ